MRPESAVVVVGGVAELAGEGDVVVGAVLVANEVMSSEEEPKAFIAAMIADFQVDQVDVSLPTGAFKLREKQQEK